MPTDALIIKQQEFLACSYGLKIAAIEFYAIQRIHITTTIIHIKTLVVVNKESRIPASDIESLHGFTPLITLGVGTHPNRKKTRISRTEHTERVALYPCCWGTKIVPLVWRIVNSLLCKKMT